MVVYQIVYHHGSEEKNLFKTYQLAYKKLSKLGFKAFEKDGYHFYNDELKVEAIIKERTIVEEVK